jgi:succinate dehydrogenase / fumarate reductase iron-sulfur subunit
VPELISSLPIVMTALLRGKMTPGKALLHPHSAPDGVKKIYEVVEGRDQRNEFNLYISGTDADNEGTTEADEAIEAAEPAGVAPDGTEGSSA